MGRYKPLRAHQPQAKTAHIKRVPFYQHDNLQDAVMQQDDIHNTFVYHGGEFFGEDEAMDVLYTVGHPGYVDFPMLSTKDFMDVDPDMTEDDSMDVDVPEEDPMDVDDIVEAEESDSMEADITLLQPGFDELDDLSELMSKLDLSGGPHPLVVYDDDIEMATVEPIESGEPPFLSSEIWRDLSSLDGAFFMSPDAMAIDFPSHR